MQHQEFSETEVRFHNIAISLRISIRDPFLSPASFACKAVVLARAPEIESGIAQPERGRLGSSRQLIRVDCPAAQTFDQMDRRREVAVKDASGNTWPALPRTIELELVHTIAGNKIQGTLLRTSQ